MRTRAARAAGGVAVALSVTLLAAGCSLPGAGAGAPSPAGTAVVDPSVPSPSTTPVVAVTTPAASATPTPAASEVVVTPTPVADARAGVVPFITSAEVGKKSGDLDVSAIVPKVVESGGTCTLVAANGATTRTDESEAVAASSYTGCEPLTIADLPAGTWQVTVRYASDESAGTSAGRQVTAG